MRIMDVSFLSPIENILFDDVLLDQAAKGVSGDVLRLWESHEVFIVLGRVGKLAQEVDLARVKADGIPVLRRSSGGGAVLQGRGCLNYSYVLSIEDNSKLKDIHCSYQLILSDVVAILKRLNIDVGFKPVSDLVLLNEEKKISGNAQRRKRNFVLHHGTILYDFPLARIANYLLMPEDVPPYRQGRKHLDFVGNINVSRGMIKKSFFDFYSCQKVEKNATGEEQQALAIAVDECISSRFIF